MLELAGRGRQEFDGKEEGGQLCLSWQQSLLRGTTCDNIWGWHGISARDTRIINWVMAVVPAGWFELECWVLQSVGRIWQWGRGKLQPQLWAGAEIQRGCECLWASDVVWEGGLKRSASPPTIKCDPGFDSMNHQGLMEGSKSPAAPPVPL